MAFTSGTVVGHKNLLKTVVDYVSGNAAMGNRKWTIKRNKDNKNEDYILEAPGLAGTDKIYFGIELNQNATDDWFNWIVTGSMAYSSEHPTQQQPFAKSVAMLLWDKSIKYWLAANGQRLILVCKVSTIYTMMYIGKFLPYGTPGQYPYPVIVSGSHNRSYKRWSDTSIDHAHLQKPVKASWLRTPGNEWMLINNAHGYGHACLYPINTYSLSGYSNSVFKSVQKNPDNSYTLLPYILSSPGFSATSDNHNIYGELDGLMWVTGDGIGSEDTVTVSGKTYLVIQNIWRANWPDYCAVLQE